MTFGMYLRAGAAVLALVLLGTAPALARQAAVDDAFTTTLIHSLGYPEATVQVGPDGVVAPAQLAAGLTVVTLEAAEPYIGYLDIVQPPVGLSEEDAIDLALAAASQDAAQPDWVYLGGTNTPAVGERASFIIDLQPGEYRWAISYYPDQPDGEEIMHLAPLTVTAGGETDPTAANPPPATVALEASDDLRYTIAPNPVPAGPQLWKFANTGTHSPHHAVIYQIPDGVTAEQIVQEVQDLASGVEPAGEPITAQFVWAAYFALQSGGQTTWAEFDLEPGAYAVICFVIDPDTGRPHVLDGMAAVFAVAP
ncbi:MAG: hypothetical protein IT337_15875 [Thermomicrobiales bacterium]|nr:hypothetical protein [Thermomicrobiales bacterium]